MILNSVILSLIIGILFITGCNNKVQSNNIYYKNHKILEEVKKNKFEQEMRIIKNAICNSSAPYDYKVVQDINRLRTEEIIKKYPTYDKEFGYPSDEFDNVALSVAGDIIGSVAKSTKQFSKGNMLGMAVVGAVALLTEGKKKTFLSRPDVKEINIIYDARIYDYIEKINKEFFKKGCNIIVTDIEIGKWAEHIFDKGFSRYVELDIELNKNFSVDIKYLEEDKKDGFIDLKDKIKIEKNWF